MIKNYFKIAFRVFGRHKLFTIINIVGLSIGISAALVIYIISAFDFSFDKFHPNSERIYRVVTNFTRSGESGATGGVIGALPDAAQTEVAGLSQSAPFYRFDQLNVAIPNGSASSTKFKNQENVVITDNRYFKLFSYKWLAGSSATALNAPNQVVLTSNQAKIYFPNLTTDQIIGREVIYDDSIRTTVSGIVQAFNEHTDFNAHDFISYHTAEHLLNFYKQLSRDNWSSVSGKSQFFVRLTESASVVHVEKQLNELLKDHTSTSENKDFKQQLALQPLSDLHFNEKYHGLGRTANKSTLYSLWVVAAFLLLLGCINFINLTTAQASNRSREIGIRKTMGSSRRQLIIQFLSETFLITLFAVIVAVILVPFLLKAFSDFIPKGVDAAQLLQPNVLLFLLLLTFAVSLLSGFYPALILSGYQPVLVLKKQTHSNKTSNAWLRKSLTVTQFVVAQFFIMATVLVSKQVYYALHKDLGFKKEAIVYINMPYKNNDAGKKQVFINKLRSIPQIGMVSLGDNPPSSNSDITRDAVYMDGKHEIKTSLNMKFADENYLAVYHIKLLAGTNIRSSDTLRQIVINATYAKILGFSSPKQAVGKFVDIDKGKTEIVGVAADFYQKSLRSAITPLAIIATDDRHAYTVHVALKPETAGGTEWKEAIATMQANWKQIFPTDEFDCSFFDEDIAKMYDSEQHMASLLTWATGLSIVISCLGLLGLAIYTINQRTKEIGVRKVLGASVAQIVTLLSTEIIGLILFAFVLVSPLAWWAMHKWMEGFADRTAISWWIFALTGGGMLFIAVLTSGFQTIKAALTNPVKSLRSE